jgi:SAM-dependent methyltransferase
MVLGDQRGSAPLSDTERQEIRDIALDLQAEIRRQRAANGQDGRLVRDPLLRVREKQVVNPHVPIGWPVMPRGLLPKLTAYYQKIARRLLRFYINPIVIQQNEYNAAAADAMTELHTALAGLEARLGQLNEQSAHAGQSLGSLDERVGTLEMAARQKAEFETIDLRLQRLENWRRAEQSQASRVPEDQAFGAPSSTAPVQIDYFLLGAKYRNRSQMNAWMTDYDDLWAGLLARSEGKAHPLPPVLDIGCGRGEYVGHLLRLGVPAYGIDLDPDALAIGQAKGLDLRNADAAKHLASLEDESLAGVVMIQVVEHFEPQPLLNLLRTIKRKLVPGGLVLAETINPACLYALSNWYLMDPSHERPVHSETARFLMLQAGLEHIEIRFLHPVPAEQKLSRVIEERNGSSDIAILRRELQPNIERLNQILYGPQDYAAIGYKTAQTLTEEG